MLHVMHDVGDGRLLVRFEGSLDERATDSVLSAVALMPIAVPVMLDLSGSTSINDRALARLSEVLKARDVRFRGLRLRHERLLESVRIRLALSGEIPPPDPDPRPAPRPKGAGMTGAGVLPQLQLKS